MAQPTISEPDPQDLATPSLMEPDPADLAVPEQPAAVSISEPDPQDLATPPAAPVNMGISVSAPPATPAQPGPQINMGVPSEVPMPIASPLELAGQAPTQSQAQAEMQAKIPAQNERVVQLEKQAESAFIPLSTHLKTLGVAVPRWLAAEVGSPVGMPDQLAELVRKHPVVTEQMIRGGAPQLAPFAAMARKFLGSSYAQRRDAAKLIEGITPEEWKAEVQSVREKGIPEPWKDPAGYIDTSINLAIENVPNMATAAASQLIPVAGHAIGIKAMADQEAYAFANAAEAAGFTDPEFVRTYAAKYGVLSAPVEYGEQLINLALAGVGGKAANQTREAFIRQLVNTPMYKTMVKKAFGIVGQGTEEYIQGLTEHGIMKQMAADWEAKTGQKIDIAKFDGMQNFLSGAGVGTVMTAIGTPASVVQKEAAKAEVAQIDKGRRLNTLNRMTDEAALSQATSGEVARQGDTITLRASPETMEAERQPPPIPEVEKDRAAWREAGMPEPYVERLVQAKDQDERDAIIAEAEAAMMVPDPADLAEPPVTPATATGIRPTPEQGPAAEPAKSEQAGPSGRIHTTIKPVPHEGVNDDDLTGEQWSERQRARNENKRSRQTAEYLGVMRDRGLDPTITDEELESVTGRPASDVESVELHALAGEWREGQNTADRQINVRVHFADGTMQTFLPTLPDATKTLGQRLAEVPDASKVKPASKAAEVQAAADKTETDLTREQRKSGQYDKGTATIHGMRVAIETPAGEKRRPTWPALKDHYGYVRGTEDNTGEPVDIFVNKDRPESGKVFVISQNKKDGTFDEFKAVAGAETAGEAKAIYERNYEQGWTGFGGVREYTPEEFKTWLKSNGPKDGTHAVQEPSAESQVSRPAQPGQDQPESGAGVRQSVGRTEPAVAPAPEVAPKPTEQAPQITTTKETTDEVSEKPAVPQGVRQPPVQLQEGREQVAEAAQDQPRQSDVLTEPPQPAPAQSEPPAAGRRGGRAAVITIDDVHELSAKRKDIAYDDAASRLKVVSEFAGRDDAERRKDAQDFVDRANDLYRDVTSKLQGVPFNERELKERVLTNKAAWGYTDEGDKIELKDAYPIPVYVSAGGDENTIGLDLHADGHFEMFEGNDEASPETYDLVNKLLGVGDKKVRVWTSQPSEIVARIKSGDVPEGIYVSPRREHAQGYWAEGRELTSFMIPLSQVAQESEVDWRTRKPTSTPPETAPTSTQAGREPAPAQQATESTAGGTYPKEADALAARGENPFPDAVAFPDAPIIPKERLDNYQLAKINGQKSAALQTVYRQAIAAGARHSPRVADMFYGAGAVSMYLHETGLSRPGDIISEYEPLRAIMIEQTRDNPEAVKAAAKKYIREVKTRLQDADAVVEGAASPDDAVARFRNYIASQPSPEGVTDKARNAKSRQVVVQYEDAIDRALAKAAEENRTLTPKELQHQYRMSARVYALRWWSELIHPTMLEPGQDLSGMAKRTASFLAGMKQYAEKRASGADATTMAFLDRQLEKYYPGNAPKLKNTADTAGFNIAMQWAVGGDMNLNTNPNEDGGLRPLFTILGIGVKAEFTDAELNSVVDKNVAAFDRKTVINADSWREMPALAEKNPGMLFVVDPSYFGVMDPATGERKGTSNYNYATEILTPEDLLRLVDKHLFKVWENGGRIVLTNTWEDGIVKQLRARGFNVVQFTRAGGEPELLAYNFDPARGTVFPLRDAASRTQLDGTQKPRSFNFGKRPPDAGRGTASVQESARRMAGDAEGETGERGDVVFSAKRRAAKPEISEIEQSVRETPIPVAKDRKQMHDAIRSFIERLDAEIKEASPKLKRRLRLIRRTWLKPASTKFVFGDQWAKDFVAEYPGLGVNESDDVDQIEAVIGLLDQELSDIIAGRSMSGTAEERAFIENKVMPNLLARAERMEYIAPGMLSGLSKADVAKLKQIGTDEFTPYRLEGTAVTLEAYKDASGTWHTRKAGQNAFLAVDVRTRQGKALATALDDKLAEGKADEQVLRKMAAEEGSAGAEDGPALEPEADVSGPGPLFASDAETLEEVQATMRQKYLANGYPPAAASARANRITTFDPGADPQWRVAGIISRAFGTKLYPLRNLGPNGVTVGSIQGVQFVDADTEFPAVVTFGHELYHDFQIRYDNGQQDAQENPYVALDQALDALIGKEQIRKYLASRAGRHMRGKSESTIRSEMKADFMGEALTDQRFWNKLFTISRRAFDLLTSAVNTILDVLRIRVRPDMSVYAYFTDVEKALDAAAKFHAAALEDSAPVAPRTTEPIASGKRGISPDDLLAMFDDYAKAPPFGQKQHLFNYHVIGQGDIDPAVRAQIGPHYYTEKPKAQTSDEAAQVLKDAGDINAAEAVVFNMANNLLHDVRMGAAVMLHAKYVAAAADTTLSTEERADALRRVNEMGHWIDEHFKQMGQAINQAKLYYHNLKTLQGQIAHFKWIVGKAHAPEIAQAAPIIGAVQAVASMEEVMLQDSAAKLAELEEVKKANEELAERNVVLEERVAEYRKRSAFKRLDALKGVINNPAVREAPFMADLNKAIDEEAEKALADLKALLAPKASTAIQMSARRAIADEIPEPMRGKLLALAVQQLRKGMTSSSEFLKWQEATFGDAFAGKDIQAVWYDAIHQYYDKAEPVLQAQGQKVKGHKARKRIRDTEGSQLEMQAGDVTPEAQQAFEAEQRRRMEAAKSPPAKTAAQAMQPAPEIAPAEEPQLELQELPDYFTGEFGPRVRPSIGELFKDGVVKKPLASLTGAELVAWQKAEADRILALKARDVIDTAKLTPTQKADFETATDEDTTVQELFEHGGPDYVAPPYTKLINEELGRLITPKAMETAIRKKVKSMGETLPRLVMQQISKADFVAKDLAAALAKEYGLPPSRAAILTDAILKHMRKMSEQSRKAKLAQMLKERNAAPPTPHQRKAIDKVMGLAFLGAMDKANINEVIAKELGFSMALTTEQVEALDKHAQAIRDAADGLPRAQAVVAAKEYIERQAKASIWRLWTAAYYNNLFSNVLDSGARNLESAMTTSIVEQLVELSMRPGATPAAIIAGLRAVPAGMNDALAAMRGKVTERTAEKLDTPNDIQIHFPRLGPFLNIPTNALVAGDLLVSTPAGWAKLAMLAYDEARKRGLGPAAANRAALDAIYGTKEQQEAWLDQARREYPGDSVFAQLDRLRRVRELQFMNMPQDMADEARRFKGIATLNNPMDEASVLDKGGKLLQSFSNKFIPAKLLAPIIMMPLRAIDRGIDYTGYGFIRARYGHMLSWKWITGGNPSPNLHTAHDVAIHKRRAQIGTLMNFTAALAAYAAMGGFEDDEEKKKKMMLDPVFGFFGPGPSDANQRAQLRKTGWMPFSIKIGPRYFPVGMLTVIAPSAMALGALFDTMRWPVTDEQTAADLGLWAGLSVLRGFSEMSVLTGWARFLNAVGDPDPERAAQSFQRLIGGSVLPAIPLTYSGFQGWLKKQIDPTNYKAENLFQEIIRRVPVVSSMLRPSLDAFGDINADSWPVVASKQKDQAADQDARLWRLIANQRAWIPRYGTSQVRTPDHPAGVPMDNEQKWWYVRIAGQLIKADMKANLDALEKMPEDQAQEAVKEYAEEAKKRAAAAVEQATHDPELDLNETLTYGASQWDWLLKQHQRRR